MRWVLWGAEEGNPDPHGRVSELVALGTGSDMALVGDFSTFNFLRKKKKELGPVACGGFFFLFFFQLQA